jgi:hypothetical protein
MDRHDGVGIGGINCFPPIEVLFVRAFLGQQSDTEEEDVSPC